MSSFDDKINNIKKVCTILNYTYDTRILDTLGSDIQLIYYNICKNNLYRNKGNKTLIKLIFNHFFFKNSLHNIDYKYIIGPLTVTRHKAKIRNLNMEFVIFGESHKLKNDCNLLYGDNVDVNKEKLKEVTITDFLYKFTQETDVFLDIYVELPMIENKERYMMDTSIQSDLISILNKFKSCIEVPTRKSPNCDLFRMHYIDSRRSEMSYKNKIEELIQLSELLIYDDLNNEPVFEKLKKELTDIYNMSIKKFKEFIINDTFKGVVLKELNKSFMKNEIREFIIDQINKKVDMYYTSAMKSIDNLFISKNIDDINIKKKNMFRISNYMIVLGGPTVDVYTLSRIFKIFDVEDNVYQPKIPNNIIIYAGNEHSKLCRDFLNTLGFDTVNLSNKSSEKCIKIDIKKFFKYDL